MRAMRRLCPLPDPSIVTWQGKPPWCGDISTELANKMPPEEHPLMGCWSVYHGIVTGKVYCADCESFRIK